MSRLFLLKLFLKRPRFYKLDLPVMIVWALYSAVISFIFIMTEMKGGEGSVDIQRFKCMYFALCFFYIAMLTMSSLFFSDAFQTPSLSCLPGMDKHIAGFHVWISLGGVMIIMLPTLFIYLMTNTVISTVLLVCTPLYILGAYALSLTWLSCQWKNMCLSFLIVLAGLYLCDQKGLEETLAILSIPFTVFWLTVIRWQTGRGKMIRRQVCNRLFVDIYKFESSKGLLKRADSNGWSFRPFTKLEGYIKTLFDEKMKSGISDYKRAWLENTIKFLLSLKSKLIGLLIAVLALLLIPQMMHVTIGFIYVLYLSGFRLEPSSLRVFDITDIWRGRRQAFNRDSRLQLLGTVTNACWLFLTIMTVNWIHSVFESSFSLFLNIQIYSSDFRMVYLIGLIPLIYSANYLLKGAMLYMFLMTMFSVIFGLSLVGGVSHTFLISHQFGIMFMLLSLLIFFILSFLHYFKRDLSLYNRMLDLEI